MRGGNSISPALKKSSRKGNLLVVFMVIFSILQIFPIIWLLDFSLCRSGDLFVSGVLKWPDKLQFINYKTAWVDGKILMHLFNSVLITGITLVATVFFSVTIGYAVTRMKWKFSSLVLNIILLGMMIPIEATLLPNFMVFSKLGINNSYLGLILPYIAFSLPMGVFIMTGFLKTLPRALEESAVIDGCGIFGIIFRIVFSVTKPAIITIAITAFINNWNEFIMMQTYLRSDTLKTLPYAVFRFQGQYSSNYAVQFAVMLLVALPSLLIYLFLNEQVTKGITVGAVKG